MGNLSGRCWCAARVQDWAGRGDLFYRLRISRALHSFGAQAEPWRARVGLYLRRFAGRMFIDHDLQLEGFGFDRLGGVAINRLDNNSLCRNLCEFGDFCVDAICDDASACGQGDGLYLSNAQLGYPMADRAGPRCARGLDIGRHLFDDLSAGHVAE